jgi:hypothetical protein
VKRVIREIQEIRDKRVIREIPGKRATPAIEARPPHAQRDSISIPIPTPEEYAAWGTKSLSVNR